jgi:SAM-dependent methyltransferase
VTPTPTGHNEQVPQPSVPFSSAASFSSTDPSSADPGLTAGGLVDLQAVWEALAQADPLWAVLSEPEKAGRQWDVDAFMASGEDQIARELATFGDLGGVLPDRALAVDFGSGVGRLSQPLATRFERVVGIDISPTMIEVARRLNVHGDRVEYVLNDKPAFPFLPTGIASFVSTMITLQHVPPAAIRTYLGEFFRIAKPGAGIVFQLPSHYSDTYLPADATDAPVPTAARVAQIRHDGTLPTLSPGEQSTITVTVRNASDETWLQSARHPLQIGNHWLAGDRGAVAYDDGRARLPGRVAPGEEVEIALDITAPSARGRYVLQLDVVQEGVCWFAQTGNPPAEFAATVARTGSLFRRRERRAVAHYVGGTFEDLISPTSTVAPMFEMNGIPRDEVEAFVVANSGVLLGAEEWVNEWVSYTYYVQVAGT